MASKPKTKTVKSSKTNYRQGRTAKQKAKTSSVMKALWAKVHKAGFTNIKDYKASLKKK